MESVVSLMENILIEVVTASLNLKKLRETQHLLKKILTKNQVQKAASLKQPIINWILKCQKVLSRQCMLLNLIHTKTMRKILNGKGI